MRIDLGCLAIDLSDQLDDQFLKYNKEEVKHYQNDLESISRLSVRSYLTIKQADVLYSKLFKKIIKHVKGLNE